MKQEIIDYLNSEPRFRERSAKWRGIADILIKKYNLELDRKKLADIIADGSSADRAWRLALKDNPSLRGKDYAEGAKLEEDYQRSLGYNI